VKGDVVAEHPSVLPHAARLRSNGGALFAMRQHWPEYLIEGAGLGLFMVSACLFATLLEHPSSPVRQAVPTALLRRIPMGLAMGLTAVAIIYSRWGQRSGAHLNPAVTLTFWRMGKVKAWDAVFYVTAQFAGASIGVAVATAGLGARLAHPAVRYAATVPGAAGAGVAFVAELLITFILMTVVLTVSNRPNLNRLTGLCAGALVASYIVVEAPLSGMSMNPARTVGSAMYAHTGGGKTEAYLAVMAKLPFPLLSDLDRKAMRSYGVLNETEITMRANRSFFLIDPQGVLRKKWIVENGAVVSSDTLLQGIQEVIGKR
jgi:aquaporin Z